MSNNRVAADRTEVIGKMRRFLAAAEHDRYASDRISTQKTDFKIKIVLNKAQWTEVIT